MASRYMMGGGFDDCLSPYSWNFPPPPTDSRYREKIEKGTHSVAAEWDELERRIPESVPKQYSPIVDETKTLIDRNRLRIAGTLHDGYIRCADTAEWAIATANVELLEKVAKNVSDVAKLAGRA